MEFKQCINSSNSVVIDCFYSSSYILSNTADDYLVALYDSLYESSFNSKLIIYRYALSNSGTAITKIITKNSTGTTNILNFSTNTPPELIVENGTSVIIFMSTQLRSGKIISQTYLLHNESSDPLKNGAVVSINNETDTLSSSVYTNLQSTLNITVNYNGQSSTPVLKRFYRDLRVIKRTNGQISVDRNVDKAYVFESVHKLMLSHINEETDNSNTSLYEVVCDAIKQYIPVDVFNNIINIESTSKLSEIELKIYNIAKSIRDRKD